MHFDDEFFESLPEEPNAGIVAICNLFLAYWNTQGVTQETVLETYALIRAHSEANNLKITIPSITADVTVAKEQAYGFIRKLREEYEPIALSNQFEQYKSEFATRLDTGFYYEFSEGDLGIIQKLINEIRELISKTEELGEGHRTRLINKLEKVQSELHKKVSNLDRFWGFCIDASIVAGLMGKNAEPMFDLVKKIVAIIWPAQTRAYELPSSLPFKLLGQSENDKSKDGKS